jgi:ribonuclease-3
MSQKSQYSFNNNSFPVSSSQNNISVDDILGFSTSNFNNSNNSNNSNSNSNNSNSSNMSDFSKRKPITSMKLSSALNDKNMDSNDNIDFDKKKIIKAEFDIDTERNKINPYNFNNKLITKNDVETILKRYGIYRSINDLSLYQQACVHETYSKGYVNNIMNRYELEIVPKPKGAIELQDKSYESFEFVGDAIIGHVIAFYLYKRLGKENEGKLSRIKSNMENRDALAHLTKTIGLNKFMLLSRYVEDKNNGRNKAKPLADMFEAFIFAMYVDFNKTFTYNLSDMYSGPGFQIVEKFLTNLFDDEETGFDLSDLILNDTNYIDKLNKYFQKFYKSKINMKRIAYLYKDKQKIQIYGVRDNDGKLIGVGKHQESRHAKQAAAKQANHYLGMLDEGEYDDDGFNPTTVDAFIEDCQLETARLEAESKNNDTLISIDKDSDASDSE